MSPHNINDAIRLLIELVEKPSLTPDDAGCQALIGERLASAGFTCESMRFGTVSNLWARFGTESPVLCFAGHTDVVPPGNLADWHSAPFEPEIRDDHLYGRGAADMKSGIAAMVVAAEQFLSQNPTPHGSLAFLITSDEEGEAVNGTRKVIEALTARGETVDWCVIGEPSSQSNVGDVVRVGRRGSLSGKLIVRGIQGHVAYPEQISNPITRFAPVLAEICERRWDDGDPDFPPTSLQFVDLKSGVGAMNVTPPTLAARFNFRFCPRWTAATLQAEFEQILQQHDLDYNIAWVVQGEPFLTQPGRLIDAAVASITKITGDPPELSTGGGTSDGRFIAPTGTEVVELGPVNETIHKVNERVRLTDVATLTRLYTDIASRLLS